MDFDALNEALMALQSDTSLLDKTNLHARAEALDTLTYISEVIHHNPQASELATSLSQGKQLRHCLENINTELFKETRQILQSPQSTPSSLRALFNIYTGYKPGTDRYIHINYEALDILISGILFPENVPNPQLELKADMVHWEASPGSVVLDLLDHVSLQPQDVFVDLGSGLGNVAILVNLLSGVRAIGVEREPVYTHYAQQVAKAFSADRVTFDTRDARNANLNTGTVFYLFTPFVSSVLEYVMERIRHVAHYHPIRICSFGPCTPQIGRLAWLHNTNGDPEHEFKLAIFQADERAF